MEIQFLSPKTEYAEQFMEWRQDKDTIKFNPLAPASLESLRKRLATSASDFGQFESADAFLWFLELNGNLVGQVSLQNINRMMRTAEIGYTIAPAARSKGVATEAVKLLTKQAFATTPLRKLFAYVHDENVSSKRVLEKAGYKQEGLLREHYLINEKPVNEALFGILKSEVL